MCKSACFVYVRSQVQIQSLCRQPAMVTFMPITLALRGSGDKDSWGLLTRYQLSSRFSESLSQRHEMGGDGASSREYTHSHMCMYKPHVFTNLPVKMEKRKTGLIPGEVSLFIGQYVVFSDRENAHGLQGRSSADVGSAQAKVRVEGSLTLRAPRFFSRKR